jgi:DegV family protein with EDD domain
MMSKVAIVTDSTSYIPHDLVAQYNISVAPQIIIWGEESLRDDIDIKPAEFYHRLKSSKQMPTTSQVTIAAFADIFERLHRQDYQILAILISEKLSGTIDSARQARQMFPDASIEIFDSISTSMALGFQALAVARLTADGATMAECLSLAEKARQNSGVLFAVDTLEFLHRGGRIGGASRYLGTLLQMKPLLTLEDGRIEALERVRTKHKAQNRLAEMIVECLDGKPNIRLATLHANAKADARALLEQIKGRLEIIETIESEVSPVVGTHVGPGTVGMAYMHD